MDTPTYIHLHTRMYVHTQSYSHSDLHTYTLYTQPHIRTCMYAEIHFKNTLIHTYAHTHNKLLAIQHMVLSLNHMLLDLTCFSCSLSLAVLSYEQREERCIAVYNTQMWYTTYELYICLHCW